MQSNRSRDTALELALRRRLHALGVRYRVCAQPTSQIRRRIDILFRPARVAVEVRGCFWHACELHYQAPKAHAAFWATKVAENRERDERTARMLEEAGWHLIVVWEHDDLDSAAELIVDLVRARRARGPSAE